MSASNCRRPRSQGIEDCAQQTAAPEARYGDAKCTSHTCVTCGTYMHSSTHQWRNCELALYLASQSRGFSTHLLQASSPGCFPKPILPVCPFCLSEVTPKGVLICVSVVFPYWGRRELKGGGWHFQHHSQAFLNSMTGNMGLAIVVLWWSSKKLIIFNINSDYVNSNSNWRKRIINSSVNHREILLNSTSLMLEC